jgi:hypothetical protein
VNEGRQPTGDPMHDGPDDGPTELVEGKDGELEERLSAGTATLLLAWLIGIGAGSALLAAWIFSAVLLEQRLGMGDLLSGTGLYVALFGASGPTILWLSGRAQDHALGWFLVTAAKMGLAMIGSIMAVAALGVLMLGGGLTSDSLVAAGVLIAATLVLSVLWALATWAADRYIAHARVEPGAG